MIDTNLPISKVTYKGEELPMSGGYPEPVGTIEITENGTHNVKDFAEAVVEVQNAGYDMSVTPNQIKMLIRIPTWNKKQIIRFSTTNGGSTVEINWGDGTVENVLSERNLDYATQMSHNYAESGIYVICLTLLSENDSLTVGVVNGYFTLSEGNLIDGSSINTNTSLRKGFLSRIIELNLGTNVKCNGFTSIPKFYSNDVRNGIYAPLHNTTSKTEVILPEGVTTLLDYSFRGFVGEYIKIPSTLTEIKNNAFDDCYVSLIDFTQIRLVDGSLPVIISNTNVFRGLPGYIVFADEETANVAKTSTNWTAYANKIKYYDEIAEVFL